MLKLFKFTGVFKYIYSKFVIDRRGYVNISS